MQKRLQCVAFVTTAAIAATTLLHATQARADDVDLAKMLSDKSPALVTIKFVLKLKIAGRDQESEKEVTGVLMDGKGMILCSNTQIGGISPQMRRMIAARGMGDVTATPTDLKVLIGDDTEGVEAKLVSRDSELDLAWVQIKEPGDKKYTYVDFEKSSPPKVGERIITLRRMSKFFDRLAVAGESRIGGLATKPRSLIVPSDTLAGGLGTPVFAVDGSVVGMIVLQMPDDDEAQGSGMQDTAGTVLPASEIVKATKRAKENPLPAASQESSEGNKGDKKEAKKDEKSAGDKADAKAKDEKPTPKK